MKKWNDRKYFIFPFGWFNVEKWKDEKLFWLVKKKKWEVESGVYISLHPYPY